MQSRMSENVHGPIIFSQVYDQLRAQFTVDDYGHYLFTPRDLTKWVMGLLR